MITSPVVAGFPPVAKYKATNGFDVTSSNRVGRP